MAERTGAVFSDPVRPLSEWWSNVPWRAVPWGGRAQSSGLDMLRGSTDFFLCTVVSGKRQCASLFLPSAIECGSVSQGNELK